MNEEIRNELLNAEMSLVEAMNLMSPDNHGVLHEMIRIILELLTRTIERWDKGEL